MTYKTLLVHVETGRTNTSLLTVAAQFADLFDARLIGIATCQPMMIVSGDGTICGDVYADDQRRIASDLAAAEAEFRAAFHGRSVELAWRGEVTLAAPASYLAAHARSVDLIMTGNVPADTFDLSRVANPGSLAIEAGRPVFMVPVDARPMGFRGALVGWKDTRECRRATADALPLLERMEQTTVIEIAEADDLDAARGRVDDVVGWLKHHGVVADGRVERAGGNDAEQLHAAADRANADVIVAGAYGHSRLREWVVGGVTRDLLLACGRGVLLSH